jgi:hypothetical protein
MFGLPSCKSTIDCNAKTNLTQQRDRIAGNRIASFFLRPERAMQNVLYLIAFEFSVLYCVRVVFGIF